MSQASSAIMANAFNAYRNGTYDSPCLTPFGLDDDAPPVHTPALEADDDTSSSLTSPIWNDFASFSLFPEQPALTSDFLARPSSTGTLTISPSELSLPLPSQDLPAPSRKRTASTDLVPVTPEVPMVDEEQRSSKRRAFTGTGNVSLPPVDVTAPTQTRTYAGPPSKTSKRPVPAAAAKKVAALKTVSEQTGADVEAEIAKSVEDKRRQNTVAARRSRMRKAEHLTGLEDTIRQQQGQIQELELMKEVWMRRAVDAGWTESTRAL